MSISRMEAFLQGYNPYTGGKLQDRCQPGQSGRATYPGQSFPQDGMSPQVNPNEVLDPLYLAQTELSKARTGINQIRQVWGNVQREVNSAYTQTNRTSNDLYPAENDTEETDNSRTGQYASSSLDQIERQLYNLRYDRSNPSSVLYEIKGQLANAQAYLNQVDANRLPQPYRHSECKSNLGQFQSQLYRIENVQQQLEDKLQALQYPINSARNDLNAVSRDTDGVSVAYQARCARGNLTTLAQQLQQIDQHLRYADGDLTQAENAALAAEQNVQTAYQDYQYNWRTSDRRA